MFASLQNCANEKVIRMQIKDNKPLYTLQKHKIIDNGDRNLTRA